MKQCTKCGQIKDESEFYRQYGRRIAQCKACRSAIDKDRYHTRYKTNPEYKKRVSAYQKEWHILNYERDKKRIAKTHKDQRLLCIEVYGGKCACCGESRYEFLSIDHIKGGGEKHRREVAGMKISRWLVKNNFPEGFRVLCHNCNQSLGHYGYCPHEKDRETKSLEADKGLQMGLIAHVPKCPSLSKKGG